MDGGAREIKGAGITPIALGLKDGFGGEIAAAGQLEKQWVNAPDDIKSLVIDGDFATDPGWTQWLDYTFQLKPYFNEDANSLGFAEGLALWQAGKTAMVFGAPGVQSVIKTAQDAGMNVGLLKMPAFGDGDWADSLANTAQGSRSRSGRRTRRSRARSWPSCSSPRTCRPCTRRRVTSPPRRTGIRRRHEPDRPDDAPVAEREEHGLVGRQLHARRSRRQRHVRRVPEDDGGRDRRRRVGSALPGRDHEVARGESRRRRELPIWLGS